MEEAKGANSPYEEVLYEHSDAVSQIRKNPWNPLAFCSASWDCTLQFWQFNKDSVIDYISTAQQSSPVYDTIWISGDTVLSCGQDGSLARTDSRGKAAGQKIFQGDCACRGLCGVGETAVASVWDSGFVGITDLRAPDKLVSSIVSLGAVLRDG